VNIILVSVTVFRTIGLIYDTRCKAIYDILNAISHCTFLWLGELYAPQVWWYGLLCDYGKMY